MRFTSISTGLILYFFAAINSYAADKIYSFNVLNQRSITLSAQYWNPILKYISAESGVTLQLKMAKTAPESSAMLGRAEFDFAYSNHIFSPENTPAGYRVIARPDGDAISGQIVTLENSPIHSLKDLDNKEVGFPSQSAFVGYAVPMNALLQAGIKVNPVFAGNQEGIMAQLMGGHVIAAGVNSQVMREYARREDVKYRVLWNSEAYLNLPISANPSVPRNAVNAVQSAFINMASNPKGLKILKEAAAIIKQKPPYGFVRADDHAYANYRQFFEHNLNRNSRQK